jgi:hypothetical protein
MTKTEKEYIQKNAEQMCLDIIALKAASDAVCDILTKAASSLPSPAQAAIKAYQNTVAAAIKAKEPSWKKFRDDMRDMLQKCD